MTLHGALPLATVKGTPVFRNAAPFAGRCWNEGLGRSDTLPSGLFPWGGRADDSGCPLDRRGGERAFVREQSVRTRRGRHRPSRRRKDTSFTRSRDLALSLAGSPSSQGERDDATPQGGAQRASDRIDSGQTCSAGGNRRRGAPRRTEASSPRVTDDLARGRPRAASEPGRRSRPPSRTRGFEELVAVRARTSLVRCRSRQAASWSRISPCSEPPKRGAAGVNGDLARFGRLRSREGPWVEGSSERMVVIQTAPWNQGAGLVMSQGGVRTPLSGPSIARAVGGSRARGTLSLERGSATGSHEGLPDDGRHPGSQRAGRVHARSVPVTSAAPLPESRPTAR